MDETRRFECSAVLLDLDGVLVDSTAVVDRTWRAWAVERGIDADELLAIAHGRRTEDTIRSVAPDMDARAEAEMLEAREARDSSGVVALAGAREFLAELPPASWAVVTSGTLPLASLRLGVTGLRAPDVLVTAEDVSRGKPDPQGYLEAAWRLRVEPGRCVVVEDAPAGIAAGLAAGMQVIALATTYDVTDLGGAQECVASLIDVSPVLGEDGSLAALIATRITGSRPPGKDSRPR